MGAQTDCEYDVGEGWIRSFREKSYIADIIVEHTNPWPT